MVWCGAAAAAAAEKLSSEPLAAGACIPAEGHCNGVPDCNDGSDELDCTNVRPHGGDVLFASHRFAGTPARSYMLFNPDLAVLSQTHGARGLLGPHRTLVRGLKVLPSTERLGRGDLRMHHYVDAFGRRCGTSSDVWPWPCDALDSAMMRYVPGMRALLTRMLNATS